MKTCYCTHRKISHADNEVCTIRGCHCLRFTEQVDGRQAIAMDAARMRGGLSAQRSLEGWN